MNLEDRLKSHLQEENQRTVVAGAGSDAAMSRAAQRKRRATGSVAAAMLFVVGVLGVSALALRDDGNATSNIALETETDAATPESSDTAAPAESTAPSSVVTVGTADVSSEAFPLAGWSRELFVTDNGVYYALATVPGEVQLDPNEPWVEPDQAIYRSDDGTNWSHTDQGSSWIARLDEHDGVLYALGTAPGSSEAALLLGTSTDDGANWNTTELWLPRAETNSAIPMSPSLSSSLAVGNSGVLAAGVVSYYPDFWAMLAPDEIEAGYSIEPREEGVVVVNYNDPEFQASMPPEVIPCEEFADMPDEDKDRLVDVEPEFAAQLENCLPLEEFENIELPEPMMPPVVRTMSWDELGITMEESLGQGQVDATLFLSNDGGNTFADVAWPFGNEWLMSLDATDSGFVATTFDNMAEDDMVGSDVPPIPTGSVWTSADGVTWAKVSSNIGESQAIGQVGDALVSIDWNGTVFRSTDSGDSFSSSRPFTAGEDSYVTASSIAASGVAIVTATYNGTNGYEEAAEPISDEAYVETYEPDTFAVYFSTDGVNWKSIDLSAEMPNLIYVSDVVIVDGTAHVMGAIATDSPDAQRYGLGESQIIRVDFD